MTNEVKDLHKRVGFIRISFAMYRSDVIGDSVKAFQDLGFLPITAIRHSDTQLFELTGISPKFEVCDDSSVPPEYLITINKTESGITTTAERVS